MAYENSLEEIQENTPSLLGTFLDVLEKIEQKNDRSEFDEFIESEFVANMSRLIQKDFDQSFKLLLKRNAEVFVTPTIHKCLEHMIRDKDMMSRTVKYLVDAMLDPEKCI